MCGSFENFMLSYLLLEMDILNVFSIIESGST